MHPVKGGRPSCTVLNGGDNCPVPGPYDPEHVCMKTKKEEITMAEPQKCAYCGKDAIGYQGFGCGFAYVCLDHADSLLLRLKPGENMSSGECYLERFSIPDQ
jgi:hypothetical protein